MDVTDGDEGMPWGWWLRATGRVFEDETGRCFSSVRDAYWEGHLGFPAVHVAPEQNEMLLRVLAAVDRPSARREMLHDIFPGDPAGWRFYMCWLASVGLIEVNGRVPFDAPLSKEGRRVLRMLRATRDDGYATLSFDDVLAAVGIASRSAADDDREAALASFERRAARLPYVFARENVGRKHLVTLTSMGMGARMPTRRVTWSQSFGDERTRDDLFAWLAWRGDRWEDWGRIAYDRGAKALTEHLLGLLVISPVPRRD